MFSVSFFLSFSIPTVYDFPILNNRSHQNIAPLTRFLWPFLWTRRTYDPSQITILNYYTPFLYTSPKVYLKSMKGDSVEIIISMSCSQLSLYYLQFNLRKVREISGNT